MRVIVLSAAFAALCLTGSGRPTTSIRPKSYRNLPPRSSNSNKRATTIPIARASRWKRSNGGGKWEEVDDIIFTPEGKRIEKVVYAPVISLRQISLSPEDVQDLAQRAALRADYARDPVYDIQYLGKEKVDDIGCYTFSVKPKKMRDGQTLFRRPDLGGRSRSADCQDLWQRRRNCEGRSGRSRSSKPTGNRSTRSTGSPRTPAPTTPCTSERRERAHPHDGEVSGLQEVRRPVHHQVRRRSGRWQGRSALHAADCSADTKKKVAEIVPSLSRNTEAALSQNSRPCQRVSAA